MSAIWPSIAEGFLTARLRVTYYTMKNCRLSDSLIAATKRNVIPATKSFYKYLKIFFAIHYISRMFSCESVFLRWNARLLTYWLREQDFARFETMGTSCRWLRTWEGFPLAEWFIMAIELSGAQFGLRSYAWFQNWTNAQREFDLKSQVWFQTKIARHEIQLPLYYIHFEIAQIQDLVS